MVLGRIARTHVDEQAFRGGTGPTAIPWCALDHHYQTPPPALRTMCPGEGRMLAHALALIQSAGKRFGARPDCRPQRNAGGLWREKNIGGKRGLARTASSPVSGGSARNSFRPRTARKPQAPAHHSIGGKRPVAPGDESGGSSPCFSPRRCAAS
jgi:hypothetical protein